MRPFKSIRSRFLAINLPIVLMVIITIVAGTEWLHFKSELDRLERDMRTFAASQSIILAAPVSAGDASRVRAAVASTISNPEIRGIGVYDADGVEIDSYGTGLDGSMGLSLRTNINDANEDGITTVGSLVIAMDDAVVFERIQERIFLGFLFGFAAIIATIVAAQVAFGRIVSTPLDKLINVIQSTKSGEKREVIVWDSEDELGRVISAFNEMQVREQHYQEELARATDTLEARVIARTRDLDRARKEAIIANNAKSAFMANMSHELRTPLNSVLGFSQILRSTRDDRWTAKEVDYLDMIESSGNILLRLIDQILDLNKIEAGAISIDVEDISLLESIQEAIGVVSTQAQAASVLVDIDIESFIDVSVKADRFRLKQILLNLLSNAIKYNRPQGSVHLSAATLEDGRVRIDIRDTGIGLTEDNMAKAFEAFNRLDQEFGGIPGAGLGLTISRQLAELMAGTITVESVLDEGSTFSIYLLGGSAADPTRNYIRLQVGD